MSTDRICHQCGTPLPAQAGDGACPKCLLEWGMGSVDGETITVIEESLPESRSSRRRGSLASFGDYELIEEIARGGMGVVYKARQISLNRVVAVKMILAGQFAAKQATQRFKAEAEAAARLCHPNIVRIHEIGEHEGFHYFSMDYVEGRNLGQAAREQSVSARLAAEWVQTVADAIHYAHEQGILHRDLKPSNILIDRMDVPHVADFGLAKQVEEQAELTVSGEVLGSPNYMPPEQARGQRDQLRRTSDVYSLGAILYHLLVGRPPFVGQTMADTFTRSSTTNQRRCVC